MSTADDKGGATHRLTVNERILLHLLANIRFGDAREVPQSLTQKGIAEAVQIRWNHVPRAMASLKKLGFVSEKSSHIEGRTRRQKAYFLTDEGKFSAKNLRERILNRDVLLKKSDGQVVKLKLSQVNFELKTNFLPLTLYMSLSEDNLIDAKVLQVGTKKEEAMKKTQRTFFASGEISWPKELVGRKAEMSTLRDWIEGDKYSTIVIYGGVGIGKSALMASILQEYRDKRDIFWYQMSDKDSEIEILTRLSEFLSEIGKPDLSLFIKEHDVIELDRVVRIVDRDLKEKKVILAFDNYFRVSEGIMDIISNLSDLAHRNQDFKIMIGSRDTTPFFCRFYDKHEIPKKKIVELDLKGLDIKGTKQMLGNPNIENDALRKIHLMTHGHPLTIELIKRGDVNSLKRIKGFSRQESSLLLYLKSVENRE